jgi:hypothetical protein
VNLYAATIVWINFPGHEAEVRQPVDEFDSYMMDE